MTFSATLLTDAPNTLRPSAETKDSAFAQNAYIETAPFHGLL